VLRDVVSTTYFDRMTTQKAAAVRLKLPWSTYRRHLQRGVALVAGWLWHRNAQATNSPHTGGDGTSSSG
jgi:hypothetical protein